MPLVISYNFKSFSFVTQKLIIDSIISVQTNDGLRHKSLQIFYLNKIFAKMFYNMNAKKC